ncbi:MAG: AmmeMemoRadiSam system protein B [Nitrospiria bacterium]
METVRKSAVAGAFYPADADALSRVVKAFLEGADATAPAPKGMIVPHAGYAYSGPIAASAYACLKKEPDRFERVVLLGPSHFVPFEGLAFPKVDFFSTPLGRIPIDHDVLAATNRMKALVGFNAAHRQEHSLEVQLPFLQSILPSFKLVPLVVGEAESDDVAACLEALWGGDETLILVSSDLSHYHDDETAKRMDEKTSKHIVQFQPEAIRPEDACGHVPLRGFLVAARRFGMTARVIDLRNSGDTSGPGDSVVGYGAFLFR